YSSIFNASPVLWLWDKAVMKSKGEEAGLMAESEREIKLRAAQRQLAQAGAAGGTVPGAPAGYGTVKRRSSAADSATRKADDDEP
ncbi:MAG: hypothetical protein MH204_01105, partial [Fimbriimonadaceae bacterium]|nr:hypothetical protein [Fimbriimonadaceae bacterium]